MVEGEGAPEAELIQRDIFPADLNTKPKDEFRGGNEMSSAMKVSEGAT